MIPSLMKSTYAHSCLDLKMEYTDYASKSFILKIEPHENKKKIIKLK